ncbi:hypothetical protein D3C86_724440 [compost metagenome]
MLTSQFLHYELHLHILSDLHSDFPDDFLLKYVLELRYCLMVFSTHDSYWPGTLICTYLKSLVLRLLHLSLLWLGLRQCCVLQVVAPFLPILHWFGVTLLVELLVLLLMLAAAQICRPVLRLLYVILPVGFPVLPPAVGFAQIMLLV